MKKQILKPRKTGEERRRNHRVSIQKRIKKYIKDGGKGDLDLWGTPIEKLPDNLQVGGDLDLMGTPIKKLSDNLQVGGYLLLTNTLIEKLPDNLKVGGSLSLINTPIKELPDNLQVGDSLYLPSTPLSKTHPKEEIRSIIEERGGYVKGSILL